MLLATLVAGCDGGHAEGAAPDPTDSPTRFHGASLGGVPMPDVTLRDTENRPFNLVTDTTDPLTVVFFGYTHCPDVCPLVLSDLALAAARLPDDVARQTQLVFITTDPARDTPAAIRAYLDRYDPAFIGLTGRLRDITTAASALHVPIEGRNRLPGGGYEVGHGAQLIGFAHDRAPVVWTEGTPVDDIVADLAELAAPEGGGEPTG